MSKFEGTGRAVEEDIEEEEGDTFQGEDGEDIQKYQTVQDEKFQIINGFIYENNYDKDIRCNVPNFVQMNAAKGPRYTDSFAITMYLLALRKKQSIQSASEELRKKKKAFVSASSTVTQSEDFSKLEGTQLTARSIP